MCEGTEIAIERDQADDGLPDWRTRGPDGWAFDPLVAMNADFNIGLLPRGISFGTAIFACRAAQSALAISRLEFDRDLGNV